MASRPVLGAEHQGPREKHTPREDTEVPRPAVHFCINICVCVCGVWHAHVYVQCMAGLTALELTT